MAGFERANRDAKFVGETRKCCVGGWTGNFDRGARRFWKSERRAESGASRADRAARRLVCGSCFRLACWVLAVKYY
jgi:membrane peptidoglycan carboxypeptidase